MFKEGDKVVLLSGGGAYPLAGYHNGKEYEVVKPEERQHGQSQYADEGYLVVIQNISGSQGFAKVSQLRGQDALSIIKSESKKH
jgi:dipeptidyl aminopeptidase/acylaminoacyl peptidase